VTKTKLVRRADSDVIECDCFFLTVAIDPSRATVRNGVHKRRDRLRFFRRAILITAMCGW